MKANELMIGDWVQGFVPDTYSRVVAIPYAYRLGIITSGGHYIETAPDDFQPIPLIPEILEKNGLQKHDDEEPYIYTLRATGIEIDCYSWLNGYYRVIISHAGTKLRVTLRFVHELQHALRLCGIEKEINL